MKKTLLFTKQNSNAFYLLLVFCLCFNYGWSQELVLNGTCDDHNATDVNDNADAWDMTPNSELTGPIASPYQAIWNNNDLEDALEIKYLGMAGTLDEQPGATSTGNGGTRGVKLYDDGSPVITGSSRRLYQKVLGLTIGNTYKFSIDSFSEAVNTPSEVYILNNEITNENGIDANKYADGSVVKGMDITNDNPDWVTTTFTFVATTTSVVIYVRSLGSINGNTEVFYDNISLKQDATASIKDVLASKLNIYPNPAKDYITVESKSVRISSVAMYNLLGAQVISEKALINNRLNVSGLAKGIYMLKINAEGSSATKKIVIE